MAGYTYRCTRQLWYTPQRSTAGTYPSSNGQCSRSQATDLQWKYYIDRGLHRHDLPRIKQYLARPSAGQCYLRFHHTSHQGLTNYSQQEIYIFHLGGNQLLAANHEKVFQWVSNLVFTVRDINHDCRIFFVGVLPKPIDNKSCKEGICKFNRWLSNAVDRIANMVHKIKFLPVQLKFLDGGSPWMQLFNPQDRLTLSREGATTFRHQTMVMAGFVRNNWIIELCGHSP